MWRFDVNGSEQAFSFLLQKIHLGRHIFLT
jgi:hypothetical protein